MSKHSPGPWEGKYVPSAGFSLKARMRTYEDRLRTFFEAPPHPHLQVEFGRDGLQLYATLGYESWTQWETPNQQAEIEANFKLIAAAPDLLEALKYAKRFLKPEDVDMAFIDAAIEKAEGKDEVTK
jgi:hypothetical protein